MPHGPSVGSPSCRVSGGITGGRRPAGPQVTDLSGPDRAAGECRPSMRRTPRRKPAAWKPKPPGSGRSAGREASGWPARSGGPSRADRCCSSTAAGRAATPGRPRRPGWPAPATAVLAFDARGHGDSDWAPDGAYSMDDLAADVRAVLAQLRFAPGGGGGLDGRHELPPGPGRGRRAAVLGRRPGRRHPPDGARRGHPHRGVHGRPPRRLRHPRRRGRGHLRLQPAPGQAPYQRGPGAGAARRRRRPLALALGPPLPVLGPVDGERSRRARGPHGRDGAAPLRARRDDWRRPRCSCGGPSPTWSATTR